MENLIFIKNQNKNMWNYERCIIIRSTTVGETYLESGHTSISYRIYHFPFKKYLPKGIILEKYNV